MYGKRNLFFKTLAQTSPEPLGLEIDRAEGLLLFDSDGKEYIDLISGISVSNLGHCHPKVVQAVQKQAAQYMHTMVYGEYILSPQVQLSALLNDVLPPQLNSTYLVNSGSEAIEGALKLAKRYTGKPEIISCFDAYHGSTAGALSILGSEVWKRNYRPLIPDCNQIEFGNFNHIEKISSRTAAVVLEVIQAEAGVILPPEGYLPAVAEQCKTTNTLLIFDEVQTGYGRTGSLFAFEHYKVVPDILVLAKGMGGGMPIGAFISRKEIMDEFTHDPVLGHISTFGGHPVSAAAANATLKYLLESDLISQVEQKGALFERLLQHPSINAIRRIGLMTAVEFESEEFNFTVIDECIKRGIIVDWFLFTTKAMRIAPPLIITEAEIDSICVLLLESIEATRLQLNL